MPPIRWLLCLLLCWPGAHAVAQATRQLYRGEHAAMGTTWTILLYARDEGVTPVMPKGPAMR